jgi:hypothetical protein
MPPFQRLLLVGVPLMHGRGNFQVAAAPALKEGVRIMARAGTGFFGVGTPGAAAAGFAT